MEGTVGSNVLEVAVTRSGVDGRGGRKRIRVNGVGRRASVLGRNLRVVLFAPEEMLLVIGPPSLRRAALDLLATARFPAYGDDLATYGRTLQQRNSLLRAIREEQATRDQLRFWDAAFLDSGARILEARQALLAQLAEPLAAAHQEIAPDEAQAGRLTLRIVTNAPAMAGESAREALARRLLETTDKEIWNGSTLIGPHRDDIAFDLGGRELAGFGSRGQQRTAILAFKLAELDLLTDLDGRPPLLLLDDVFSELDPSRSAALLEHLPPGQSLLTTASGLPEAAKPDRVVRIAAGAVVALGGAA